MAMKICVILVFIVLINNMKCLNVMVRILIVRIVYYHSLVINAFIFVI